MTGSPPRMTIAALKGGSGKTIVTLGLVSVFKKMGYRVAPFKKGPDFIDAGWLTFAAGIPCHNLDPFMMTPEQITHSFLYNSANTDISLIEGNRGIFDGLDIDGCCSTAELGRLLKSPVLLIIDVTMSTRTVAALVMGCQKFDPELNIVGIILNRVAAKRQETLVTDSIERYCDLPIVGSLPKYRQNPFPERHMGLVPHQEQEKAEKAIEWAREIVKDNLDLDTILSMTSDVDLLEEKRAYTEDRGIKVHGTDKPVIGYIKDSSFWFYYPENLNNLKALGTRLIEIDSVYDKELPELDALYIGGGFPETKAEALANNNGFRESLKQAIENGLPVYAECGGLIYMGEALVMEGKEYPMTGALPIKFMMGEKPQGHGYTVMEVKDENPYFPEGEVLKGHEFHYSRPIITKKQDIKLIFSVKRGHGLDGTSDGILKNNLLGTYMHLHAGGNRIWCDNFFKAAINYNRQKRKISEIFTKGLTLS